MYLQRDLTWMKRVAKIQKTADTVNNNVFETML